MTSSEYNTDYYTPEERAFYDNLVRHNRSEEALRRTYIDHSDLKHRDFTPEELEKRLHEWIKDGVVRQPGHIFVQPAVGFRIEQLEQDVSELQRLLAQIEELIDGYHRRQQKEVGSTHE